MIAQSAHTVSRRAHRLVASLLAIGLVIGVPTAVLQTTPASASSAQQGTVRIVISGVRTPLLSVTRADGWRLEVTRNETLRLPYGAYTVTAPAHTDDRGTYRATPEITRIRVSGRTVVVTVRYRRPGAGASLTSSSPTHTVPNGIRPTTSRPAAFRAPASAPPTEAFAALLNLINNARAEGRTCESKAFAPTAALSYSLELATVSQGYVDRLVQGAPLDAAALFRQAGYLGRPGSPSAANCPLLATPSDVAAALFKIPIACEALMDPAMDQVGLGYTQSAANVNTWGLTFGNADPSSPAPPR